MNRPTALAGKNHPSASDRMLIGRNSLLQKFQPVEKESFGSPG
jgi:hypothetical protein